MILHPTWNPFSRYADNMEKKLDRVLKKVAFLGIFEAQRRMLDLMQENLVIVNMWLEARFKGYKYLSRGKRKKLYRNAQKLTDVFRAFCVATTIDLTKVSANLSGLGLHVPSMPGDEKKLVLLAQIMEFLRPHAGRYEYLEGASFGKLLSDPEKKEKMIGDCNQIVTLYTFLYAQSFSLQDLQIKLLPNHVCLHFKGVDIEATAGAFANYKNEGQILPISELISTNLLDVSDFRDKQIRVAPRDFLRAAQLAVNLSSNREIVGKNLTIAYRNVAIENLEAQEFDTALFFLEKTGTNDSEGMKLLQSIYHNAVLYHVKSKSFSKARFYAGKAGKNDLERYVDEHEAVYNYENNHLDRARELFGRVNNQQMIKACYGKEYNSIQSRVAGLNDLAAMRGHKHDYRKMLELAQKMGDQSLVDNLDRVLRQL